MSSLPPFTAHRIPTSSSSSSLTKNIPLTLPWIPLGDAMMDYCCGDRYATIIVKSTIEGDRAVPVSTFFREKDQFPKIEKDAFNFCKGSILDVGAGAGPHALYLQNKGFDVSPMDISPKAAEVMQKRGLQKAFFGNIFEYKENRYDTILMMMNGIGIAGDLENLGKLLRHIKVLVTSGGQILFDSTDIGYVTSYDRALSSLNIPFPEYYGTVHYQLEYKDKKGEIYPWLFVDAETLKQIAAENGYVCKVLKTRSSQYLAKLTLMDR